MVDEKLSTKPRWDAVVIGSGLGGLTTAAYLATNGVRTLVLEQHEILGGCSQVFRRKRRYEFDVGLHYVGDCGSGGILPTVLRGVGLEGRVEFTPMDEDGFDTIVCPDFTLRVPVGWEAFTERMVETFPDERDAITRCLHDLRAIGSCTERLYAPPGGSMPREALRAPVSTARAARSALMTVDAFLDGYGLSSSARAVLTGYAGLFGTPPWETPVPVMAFFFEHLLRSGGWYPRGGGQVIAAHLVDVIRAHGGAVRTKARVDRLLVSGGRVHGVRIEGGETFRAPVVVSNADVKRTYLDLVGREHLRRATVRNARRWRMAGRLVTVYLGVDFDLADAIPATNFWVMPEHSMEWPRGSRGVPSAEHMPAWITSAATKDPDGHVVDGRGHTTLEAMTFLPADDDLWAPASSDRPYSEDERYIAFKQQAEDALVEQAARTIPAIRDRIAWRESSTPLSQHRYTSATHGTWGGVAVTRSQLLSRPRYATEIDGLFLAGGSTLYGPGITGVVRGGIAAAGRVLGRDLWKEVRGGRVFADRSRLTAGGPDWDPYFASKRHAVKRPPRARTTAV